MQLSQNTSTKILKSLAIGITILSLTSCGKPEAATTPTPATEAAAPAKSDAAGFAALQGVVDKTTAAVVAKKLDVAKQEFDKFEASWKPVEDGVKAKSSAGYNAIEEGIDGVNKGIKDKNEANITSSLQSLSKAIASLPK